VPISYARSLLTAVRSSRVGTCAVLAVATLLLGNRALETAVANGDTRTLSLHHIHTDEDITITYKRDGRYDEDALKKLDRFLRDWRKEEEIHMDPQLFDLIWEVSREVGGDKAIHVVCGYRSPATNEMLRHRSNGVARFSQHTLGKAMDFYIPGADLEQLRIAGLRMQRGGVGYYPTSGSPFVHLDVGGVRYWPRMSREQLARVFPDGRTIYLPSDGRPLSGYALALADIEKRNSSGPSHLSLAAAHDTGVNVAAAYAPKKNPLAALFSRDEDDDAEPAKQAVPLPVPAPASRRAAFSLAAADSPVDPSLAAEEPVAAVPVPHARPAKFATAVAAAAPVLDAPETAAPRGYTLASVDPPRPPGFILPPAQTRAAGPETTSSIWSGREADNDHVPLDMVLAYAAPPQTEQFPPARRPEPMGETAARAAAAMALNIGATNTASTRLAPTLRDAAATTIAKKSPLRTAPVPAELVRSAKPTVVVANAGMRYDDPWLRAMILTPSLTDSMTATLYGEPDMTELRTLMNKPSSSVAMSFDEEPYPGIAAGHFSGEAVVFLTTTTFQRRTASLR
jgi:uncharacterized protein YcbK (DUF882 family)